MFFLILFSQCSLLPSFLRRRLFLFILSRCQCLFLFSFPNAPRFLLFCFRLFYANEFVEDDVGEETIAQTSTAEQSGPL